MRPPEDTGRTKSVQYVGTDAQPTTTTLVTYEAPYTLVDGPMTVRTWWDSESECWMARLVDDDSADNRIQFLPLAHGDTKEAALANLAMCIWVGLIE